MGYSYRRAFAHVVLNIFVLKHNFFHSLVNFNISICQQKKCYFLREAVPESHNLNHTSEWFVATSIEVSWFGS